jgi:hypothetical protein
MQPVAEVAGHLEEDQELIMASVELGLGLG